MKVGLNLYSVRNLISNEKDFLDTSLKLKEYGYSYIQYSGGPYDPKVIKRVSEESGLPVYLTHVSLDRILHDTDKLMEEHASFGCYNIGNGYLPIDKLINEENGLENIVKELSVASEKMKKNGFKLFHHNHQCEFIKFKGKTILEYMCENAPDLNYTFDTYWAQYGGVELSPFIKKLKGKIDCVHLKDYVLSLGDNGLYAPKFAPIGDGTIDFKNLVKVMKEADVKYFFVEQDNAAELPDTLSYVKKSIDYIKSELKD